MTTVIEKYRFLGRVSCISLNERQGRMVQKLAGCEFYGVLITSKWAKLMECSTDSALRDINDLIAKGILEKDESRGGRSTSYILEK